MTRPRNYNPPSKAKAWVAGWDASLTFARNPYKRRDFRRWFDLGKSAGFRATDIDVAALNRMVAELRSPR